MRLLALDAALGACSVAFMTGGRLLGLREGGDSRLATSVLPGLVQGLLAEHGRELDAVAVTIGPGSFTGLRGALALAHGLAIGAGVPVVAVTVAEALRAAVMPAPRYEDWVALDSRRAGRIFLDRGDGMVAVSLDALPTPAGPVRVLGDAAPAVVAVLRQTGTDAVMIGQAVSAAAVGQVALWRLAGDIPPCDARPLYVEPPEARAAAHLRPAPV